MSVDKVDSRHQTESKSDHDHGETERLELKDVVRNILEEARMVLPGIQALFGFQLIAVFNAKFAELSSIDKGLHLTAIVLTIVAIGLLTAPAAYHRHNENFYVSRRFVMYASKLLRFGMTPLMLSISLDTYVVSNLVTGFPVISVCISLLCLSFLFTFWYVIPHMMHRD